MELLLILDTGDIILTKEFALDNEINAGELHDKMKEEGSKLLIETLNLIKENKAPRTVQNHSEHTYAPIMKKSLGEIDWTKTATEIHNLVRGVNPWPSAYTNYGDLVMKVWKTKVLDEQSEKEEGSIIEVSNCGIKVSTKEKVVLIEEIQLPGKKRVKVSDFIKGNKIDENIVLK